MMALLAVDERQMPARKGPSSRLLGQSRARTLNRAARMAAQLERWMRRYARFLSDKEAALLQRDQVVTRVFDSEPKIRLYSKAETPSQRRLRQELFRILVDNGVPALDMAARRTAGMKQAVITDRMMAEFMRSKQVRLQQIMASTEIAVKESVRQIILTALEEPIRPSTLEIGRRIARVFHGDAGGRETGRVPAPLIDSRVLPTSRVELDTGGNLYVFSPERAALIARTEMAQAENEGIVRGYEATGVEEIEWLAYNDGRSGRGHDKMRGKRTRIGVPFVLPDGTKIRWPGDSLAPIKHTANCRCGTKGVIV